jgi:hypothetical protein
MKVKIFKYKLNGQIYTDSYLENDEIKEDYSDAELFEFDIQGSRILEKAKEYLGDRSYFYGIVYSNHKLVESSLSIAHDYIKNDVYKGDFREKIEKIAKEDAISDIVGELRQKVEENEGN